MPLSAIPERHAVDAEFRVVSDILPLMLAVRGEISFPVAVEIGAVIALPQVPSLVTTAKWSKGYVPLTGPAR
jgi:hypothetical protein